MGREIVARSLDIGDLDRHPHKAFTAASQKIDDRTRVAIRLWRKQ